MTSTSHPWRTQAWAVVARIWLLRLLAAFVASLAFAAPATQAQELRRSAVLAAVDDGLGGFNASFGDTFAAATQGRSFSDTFTFDTSTPFDVAASLSSSYLDTPQTKDLSITGLNLYRYDPATGAVLGSAIAGIDATGFGANPTDLWTLSGYGLAAGAYALRIDGRVAGAGGGAFGGDLTMSPVPEPQAWTVLLAGLCSLGLAAGSARRRDPARTGVPIRIERDAVP